MIANAPTLLAALLLGLAASGHCLVMCGGISAALGIATAKRADGKPRRDLLVAYQLGRVTSYVLAGLLLGGLLGSAIALLDIEAVRRTLRVLSAIALLLGALVASGRLRDPGFGIGRRLWPRLAPLGRRLLPVANLPRAFAFGMVWGWMPCGFVYTVLLIAALQLDAWHAAATMALFGLGTAPALLAYDAAVEVVGAHGSARIVPLADFWTGPGQTVLQPGEFVASVRLPPAPEGRRSHYRKLAVRKAMDLAMVGITVCLVREGEGARDVRIALGAVAPVCLRAREAERVIEAEGARGIERAAALAEAAVSPIDDQRASAAYRREMARVLTAQALRDLLGSPV